MVPPGPAARPDRTHVRPASYLSISLVLSLLLFVLFLAGDRGFLQVRRQRAQVSALQAEVSALAVRNQQLETEIGRLKTDPPAVERIAREELQLVDPGDVVLVLPQGWEKRVSPTPLPGSAGGPAPDAGTPPAR